MPAILFLLLQQAAEAPPADDPESQLGNYIFFAVFAAVLVGGGYFVWRRAQELEALNETQQREEQQFEFRVLAEMTALPPATNPDALPAAEPIASPQAALSPPPAEAVAPTGTVNDIVERLRAWKLLESIDGRVPLPMPPDGVIVRFTGRLGTGVILPRLEGEATLAHFAKRFDIVICATPHGEPLVLSRLQERFRENLRV